MTSEQMQKMDDEMAGRSTAKVPIDMVDADQLPRETALKYEELCMLVGSLYIDSNHRISTIQEQAKAIHTQLQEQIIELRKDNVKLRERLDGSKQPETPST